MTTFFAVIMVFVSIAGVAITFVTIRKPMRLRPRFDYFRLAIAIATIVLMTAVSSIATEPAVAVVALLMGGGGGWLIGRRADIWEDEGTLWFRRAGLGVLVWGVSTVMLQVAALADRADLVDLGRFGSWFGIGVQVGVLVGRMDQLNVVRAAAAAVTLLALGAVLPRQAGTAAAGTIDGPRWVLVETVFAEMDFGSSTMNHTPGSMNAVTSSENFTATFTASYDVPPAELEPDSVLEIDVSVEGSVEGTDQQFAGLSVIQYSYERWTDDAVGLLMGCNDPIGSAPLTCDEPQAAAGTFSWNVPFSGRNQFSIGVGALNCSCAITWIYEYERPDTEVGATADSDSDFTPAIIDSAGNTLEDGGSTASPIVSGLFPDDIPDEGAIGAVGGLGAGGAAVLTVIEARESARRRRDDGWVLEPPDLDSAARSGSAFEDELSDYIDRLPPPGEGVTLDELFDKLREAAEQGAELTGDALEAGAELGERWNRPIDLDELQRVWDALGAVTHAPSESTAAELQEALAALLDRNAGGMPTWLAAWALRNPEAAAETLVRMAAATYTGGASELALIPTDVYRDINAAKEAARKRGEPFEFGDAIIAGTRGQAMGWFMDGGGALVSSHRREAAERLGRKLGDAADEWRAAGRHADANRHTDPMKWPGLDDAKPGTKIPPDVIREAGYTPHQAAELQRVAAEEGVIIGTRTTNPDATRFIEDGTALPKPVYMKAKTIGELDAQLGGPPGSVKGQVGFFEPTRPPEGSSPELMARFEERLKEYDKLKDTMDQLEAEGVIKIKDGVVHKVLPDGSTKPFAGDIDAVAVLDAKTGRPITGQRYQEVVANLEKSGAKLQHGAESNIVGDIVRARTQGMDKTSPEFAATFDKAVEDAEALGAKLEANHLEGKEQVIWTHARGHYKGPQTNKLGSWQEMTRGDVPPRPPDVDDALTGLPSVITTPMD